MGESRTHIPLHSSTFKQLTKLSKLWDFLNPLGNILYAFPSLVPPS